MEYVGREEQNEFVKRIEDAVEQNMALTISVEKLAKIWQMSRASKESV